MPATVSEAEFAAVPVVAHSLAVLDTGAANVRVWLFDGPSTVGALRAAASGALNDLQATASQVLVLPNVVVRSRVNGSSRSKLGSAEVGWRSYLAGPEIGEQVGVYARLQLRSPIERGFITDWAAQSLSWSTTLQHAHAVQQQHKSQQLVASNKSRRSDAPTSKKPRRPGSESTTKLHPPPNDDKPPVSTNRRKSSTRGGLAMADVDVGQPWPGPGPAPLLWGRSVLVTEPYFNMPELALAMDTLLFEEYGAAAVLRASPAELAAWCLRVPPAEEILDVFPEAPPFSPSYDLPITSPSDPIQPPPEAVHAPEPKSAPRGKRKRSTAANAAAAASGPSAMATMQHQPEATLVLDCGHSYCHAVPLVRGRVVWGAVKRLDFGGKHVTNLLKNSLSFGQWDLSEDTWLVGKAKERTSFVAASAGLSQRSRARATAQTILNKGPDAVPPHRWSFATLVELCKLASNSAEYDPIALEYVLPDYSSDGLPPPTHPPPPPPPSVSTNSEWNQHGGDSTVTVLPARAPVQPADQPTPLSLEQVEESTFIGRYGKVLPEGSIRRERLPLSGKAWSHRDRDTFICPSHSSTVALPEAADDQVPDEEAQTLRLTTDRFIHTEAYFAPTRVPGLGHPFPEQMGLGQLAFAAAKEAEQLVLHRQLRQRERSGGKGRGRDQGAGAGLLLANVLLVGGGACIPGLAERLEQELRPLAPEDTPVRVRVPLNPISAAAEGGAAFLLASLTGQHTPTSASASRRASHVDSDETWQSEAMAALAGRFTTRLTYLDRTKRT